MKKLIYLLCAVAALIISTPAVADETSKLTVNVGVLAPYTMDANIGYEHHLNYGNAFEIFANAGNHWHTPVCHNFWKGYFWDGGVIYKHRLAKFKNGNLRILGGVNAGAERKEFFFGVEAGFEYNYVFKNDWEFSVTQKNTVNFPHGDLFRNGLLVGVKIPF